MRILFLNYEFPPLGGGGANATSYLFDQFSEIADLEIDCVTSAWQTGDVVEQLSENIRLYRLDVGKRALHFWSQREVLTWLFRSHSKVKALVENNNYDVCHAFFGFPSGMIAWMQRNRIPYLVSLRGSDVPGFNPRFAAQYVVLKPLFRKIWGSAGSVVANSVGLKSLAGDFMSELAIDTIPNGIDVDQFSYSQEDEKVPGRILCVSRLVERKGVHDLIDAMPAILGKCPSAHLVIVGEGDQKEALGERCHSLNISDKVMFRGYVGHDYLPELYRSAELFVQPSYYEGMSNTILEAMASGLPIVATGEGGKEELLKENSVKSLFGNPERLAKDIISLLTKKEMLSSMGKVSRQIAEQYSWESVAQSYLDIYKSLASSHPTSHVPHPGV